jgi:hypothetical protein
MFLGQQLLLSRHPICVAVKGAIGSDDSVAGNHHSGGIGRAGAGDCSGSEWFANCPGNLLVTSRLAIGDTTQLFPHLPLKRCTADIKGQIRV